MDITDFIMDITDIFMDKRIFYDGYYGYFSG